jgi:L-lactate dehydrogenase (cytochrome)
MAKLGHPLGEINLTRAAAATGLIQGISNNATCSMEEIANARVPGQVLFPQTYLHPDREITRKRLELADKLGMQACIITVDGATNGKRERYFKLKGGYHIGLRKDGKSTVQGASSDVNICWDDLK